MRKSQVITYTVLEIPDTFLALIIILVLKSLTRCIITQLFLYL
ncbi:hypothetical protein MuYL_4407 [Mucilaginibacter xinganensis]|uniref:Uncharacterized protein n=1 Tax=Mucilaginibacter xinganensis TaxID=1234841 RepID=A0A223P2H6_9SPHI|nr:hypothetical protein MuYL_4407 [Mucilaginibacter xinganensis]